MSALRFGFVAGLVGAFAVLGENAVAGGEECRAYNFDSVTTLARGMLVGENVFVPVDGFELLLMVEGDVVYQQAFGDWSVGQDAASDSSTKTLSGAVILSLADNSPQPFALDTRLSEYIPEFDGDKAAITIRQCFAHFAGFGSSTAMADPSLTLNEAAVAIAGEPLAYPAGTVFFYGGTSMHVAGAVAEEVAGISWNALFEQRIAGPLDMTETFFDLTTPANPRVAGGARSTAAEFARFMEMLRAGGVHDGQQVLSPSSVAAMFTRQTPTAIPIENSPLDSADYGVGVWLDQRTLSSDLVGALAAGARGFSSWIDFDDGVVGALATDRTLSQNIRVAVNLIRFAAQQSVRNPARCGDVNSDGTTDQLDYSLLSANFGTVDRLWAEGDVTGDGVVDCDDYGQLVTGWNGAGAAPILADCVDAVPCTSPAGTILTCAAMTVVAMIGLARVSRDTKPCV